MVELHVSERASSRQKGFGVQELEQGRYATFRFDPERRIVELQWSSETSAMTEDEFRALLGRSAKHAEDRPGSSLVIDVRRFGYSPASDNMSWREREIVPRSNAARVRKFAFLVPAGAAGGSPMDDGPANFPTRHFDSRDQLDAWLAED